MNNILKLLTRPTTFYLVIVSVILYYISKIFGKGDSGSGAAPIEAPTYTTPPDTVYNAGVNSYPYSDYVDMAISLFNAMDGMGTDVDTIESIFNKLDPYDLPVVAEIYQKTYKQRLADRLKNELGLFNGDLISYVKALYSESGLIY